MVLHFNEATEKQLQDFDENGADDDIILYESFEQLLEHMFDNVVFEKGDDD